MRKRNRATEDEGGASMGTLVAGLILAALIVFACSWLGMAAVGVM